MKKVMICLFVALMLSACSKQEEQPADAAAEFGICYDARNCPSGQQSALSVTKNQCDAAGGKSWKGGTSGCVNL